MKYKDFFNEDLIPGGKGDKANLSKFDPKQVAMGIKVEREHSNDPSKILEIVLDHLTENPAYYTKLKKSGLADELKETEECGDECQCGEEEITKDEQYELDNDVSVLSVPTRINGISLGKIIGVGKAFSGDSKKESIPVSGNVCPDKVSSTVGGDVVDKMTKPNSTGKIEKTPPLTENKTTSPQYPFNWNGGFKYPIVIGAGGKEVPFLKNDVWYLRVWDDKDKVHYLYNYSTDILEPEL